jgi:hypothetical protein
VVIAEYLRRLAIRIGRRGASLLFVGLVALVLGLSIAAPPEEVRDSPGYMMLASVLPLGVWAAAWGVTGVTCLFQAFMRSDRVAFALATALMTAWGIVYGVGAVIGTVPRGWVAAAVWLGFGGWLTLISTWPEAPDTMRSLDA